jgi:hypothetical protein
MTHDPGNAQPPASGWLFPTDDDTNDDVPEDRCDDSDFDDEGVFTL